MATSGAASSPYVSAAPRLGFVGGFDGVRGIGILMVLFNHAYSDLSPSFAGIIDVLFVMSAFLITTLLMQEHRDQQTISMRKFYARRAVRLLPSAYLCIAAWFAVCLLFDRERLAVLWQEALGAVTYVYQFVFPVGVLSVDPSLRGELSIDQFWSLAVEEQFYLLIAVTVLVCIRKRWMNQLAIGLAVVAAYIGYQRWIGNAGPVPIPADADAPSLQRGLSLFWLSRPDSLMWGVGLAVLNSHLPDPLPDRWRRWLPRVGLVGLVVAFSTLLLASGFLNDIAGKVGLPYPFVPIAPPTAVQGQDGVYWINFGHTVAALAFAPAMLAMARIKEWGPNRALSWKPVRFLGRMSYTVYVWHTFFYFVILDLVGFDSILGQKTRVPIIAAVTIVLCLPIYYGVEQRMLRVKLRFASEKEVLDLNTGKMVTVDDALKRKSVDPGPESPPDPPNPPAQTAPDVER
ncbi:MAG TPA: acyltransferase, partial [Dermatophilaceae bacterium]|nr:acyltransferase [Dermatophilaceae bacterium]